MATNGMVVGGLSILTSSDLLMKWNEHQQKVHNNNPWDKIVKLSHCEQAQLMRNFDEKARAQHNTNALPDASSPQPARNEDSSNAYVAAASSTGIDVDRTWRE